MVETVQILVLLLAVVAAVAVLAARLEIPPAILLVIAGVILALVPGLPSVELAPELVLLLVLPPVIYSASVAMSWREFRFNLRPISLLVVVLEGEGLANDATALILYRFAVAAVSLGTFSFGHAVGTFFAIVVGELLWGIGVGWLMLRLRRWVNEPPIEIILSVLTPFLAFWPPMHLGGSGVLATLAAGLYVSWNGPRLISPATRLQGVFFWEFFTYVIEGMVFVITGLQARTVIGRISHYPLSQLALSVTVITAVVIVARFVWVFPATYLPRWLFPPVRKKDPSPP